MIKARHFGCKVTIDAQWDLGVCTMLFFPLFLQRFNSIKGEELRGGGLRKKRRHNYWALVIHLIFP